MSFIDKEQDAESGDHNFGVRQYDNGIGRFMAIDPLWEQFPSLSPYNYSSNNPIQFVDPSGKSAEATIDEGVVHIKMHFVFYSNSISDRGQMESLSKEVLTQIQDKWNNASANIGGKDYTIQLSLTSEIVDATQAADMSQMNEDIAVNFVGIEEGSGSSVMGNQGIFKTEEILNSKTTVAHEFGHLLGINIHSEEPALRGTSIGFKSGEWDIMLGNNFGQIGGSMAKGYDPELRRVTATNVKQFFYINELLKHANRPAPGPNRMPISFTKKTLGTN